MLTRRSYTLLKLRKWFVVINFLYWPEIFLTFLAFYGHSVVHSYDRATKILIFSSSFNHSQYSWSENCLGFIWVYFSSILSERLKAASLSIRILLPDGKKIVDHLFYQKRLKFWQEIENTPEFFKNVSRILITTSCLSWLLPCIYAVLSMHLYFFFLWAKVNSRGT